MADLVQTFRRAQIHVPKNRPAENAITEICPAEIRPAEARLEEARPPKVRLDEIGC